MAKKIDLNRTVFELTQEYPELIDILAGLGFTEITKKPMLHSAGKIMTIPKGAKLKKIPMIKVVKALLDNGFILAGEMSAGTDTGTGSARWPPRCGRCRGPRPARTPPAQWSRAAAACAA